MNPSCENLSGFEFSKLVILIEGLTSIKRICNHLKYNCCDQSGFAFLTVILLFSGTFVMHVRTRFPSSMTSQEEQLPCLQLKDNRSPDLTHARLNGCSEAINIVFPVSRLETHTCSMVSGGDQHWRL